MSPAVFMNCKTTMAAKVTVLAAALKANTTGGLAYIRLDGSWCEVVRLDWVGLLWSELDRLRLGRTALDLI